MISGYDGVKVFSVTQPRMREALGETVTAWTSKQKGIEVMGTVVRQSSDASFHCITIIVFFKGRTDKT